MSLREKEAAYDVIVVGGDIADVCTVIVAAREDTSVAIMQNRSVFGGAANSEIRMHIAGANCRSSKPDLREIRILEEILLENKQCNPYTAFPVFDIILWEKVFLGEGVTTYLNTDMNDVTLNEGQTRGIACHQNSTETQFTLCGTPFIDATGHGTLGVMAGAASRVRSEARAEFRELTAPKTASQDTMRSTTMSLAVDRGEPVWFEESVWIHTYTEEDLKYRSHVNETCAWADDGDTMAPEEEKNQLPEFSNVDAGCQWIELDGDYSNIIEQDEEIRDGLLKYAYGIWDHIKDQGNHGVENYDLEWVGMVPGYRESRRLEGEYILNEDDVRASHVFENAMAYGGRPMDVHVPGGIRDLNSYDSKVYNFGGCYTIPYRYYVSRDVDNLMMAGRDINTSKMAFPSTRVMGACAMDGQAVGTAAVLAIRYGCTPKQVGEQHIRELQRELTKDDYYLPGFADEDEADIVRTARVSTSSEQDDGRAEHVTDDVARNVNGQVNCWKLASLEKPRTLTLKLFEEREVRQVRLTFDADLGHEIQPSVIKNVRDRQAKGFPRELVKDYRVSLPLDGNVADTREIRGNGQRPNVLDFGGGGCDGVQITVKSSHRCDYACIFEVGVY